MSLDPHEGYRRQRPGEHPGAFEDDARVWRSPPREIAQTFGSSEYPSTARVTVEATKPDARVTLRLTLGFWPEGGGAQDDLNYVCPDAATLRAHLAATKVWLSGCDAYGGGLRECENLVGTEAVPVSMVADGLWGAVYEVDVDVKAVRARLDLALSGVPGRWLAIAKWVAVDPMSDRDWVHARQRMDLTVSPPRTQLKCVVGK